MKLSEILKPGDKVTVYKDRGANWRLPVLEVNDETQQALLDSHVVRPCMGPGWYDITISAKGIPYSKD